MKKILFLIAAVVTLYSMNNWEWGMMDDVGLHISAEQNGIVKNILESAKGDKGWGLFRPSYWAYSSSVYLLSPRLVYSLRLIMVLSILIFALLTLATACGGSSGKKMFLAFGSAALMANRPLYDGLSFLSLQETSGLFFAALGIYAAVAKKRDGFAGVLFLIAAGFKPPFVWLALLLSVKIFRSGRRVLGGVLCLLATCFLLTALSWAKAGAYTSRVGSANMAQITLATLGFVKVFAFPLFCLLGLSAVRMIAIKRADIGSLAVVILLSGILYLVTLLPWGASTGYYFGPPVFLLTLGMLLLMASGGADRRFLKSLRGTSNQISTIAAAVCLVVGTAVFGHGLWKVWARNLAIVSMRDWALSLPASGLTLAINGAESAVRLEQLLVLRSDGRWKNQVRYSTQGDYLVLLADQGPLEAPVAGQEPIIKTSMLRVYPR